MPSNFNELQRLGEISDDESTPPFTPATPEPFGIEEESCEIKIHRSCSQAFENSVQISEEGY